MGDALRFDGRVAIVTGAGRGLGRAYALALAARGASVVVNDDIGAAVGGGGFDAATAEAVVAEIRDAGGTAVPSIDSVATTDGAEAISATAVDAFGRVDALVNNAGVVTFKPFEAVDLDDFERHLAVHLSGSFNVTRAVWPHMARQGYGRVVMTTSSAILGVPTLVSYGSAKAGVVGLGRALALAGAPVGIRVNVASPLAITRMWTEMVAPGDPPPEGPSPDEVPPLVCYLCHADCTVNGEIFRTAGGRVSRLFLAETDGAPAATPEEIRDGLDRIMDETGYYVPPDSASINARAAERAARPAADPA